MEVKEVLNTYIDPDTNILEVSFRLSDDSDDIIRTDNIDFDLTKEYGYDVIPDDFGFLDSELIEDGMDNVEETLNIDQNELINFLTEFYTTNPGSLPKEQIF